MLGVGCGELIWVAAAGAEGAQSCKPCIQGMLYNCISELRCAGTDEHHDRSPQSSAAGKRALLYFHTMATLVLPRFERCRVPYCRPLRTCIPVFRAERVQPRTACHLQSDIH